MTTELTATPLSIHEALARQVIQERIAVRHRATRSSRRHIRTAVLLRRLAARLDPETPVSAAARPACPAPVGTEPRPWRAVRRGPDHARH